MGSEVIVSLVIRTDRGGALARPAIGSFYDGIAARVQKPGDALDYGTHEEYRDHEELARVVTELVGKPFTLLHPDGLISEGAGAHIIGTVMSANVDGDNAAVRVQVTDPEGDEAIASGTHELSMGYVCRLDENGYQRHTVVDHLALVPRARCGRTCSLKRDCEGCAKLTAAPIQVADPGCACHLAKLVPSIDAVVADELATDEDMTEDGKLSAAQRKAIPAEHFGVPATKSLPLEDANHVRDAMARFGETHFANESEKRSAYHRIVARAHDLGIDASNFTKEHGSKSDSVTTTEPTRNLMDELQKQLADTQKALIESTNRLTASEKARVDAEALLRVAQSDLTKETARADAADKARKDAVDEAFTKAVASKVALIAHANTVLGATDKDGKSVDRSAMSDRDIKVAIVKHVDGDDIASTEVDAYVDGMFAGAIKRHAKSAGSRADVRVEIQALRADGAPTVAASGRNAERAEYDAMLASLRS